MTKTKQPKPIKAWALVGKDGEIPSGDWIFRTRKVAFWFVDKKAGERIVRVEIKVLK